MKTLYKCLGLGLAMAISTQMGSALASSSMHGAVCAANSTADTTKISHGIAGVKNVYGASVPVSCAVSNDHNIGTPQFDIVVGDNNTSANISCRGVVMDSTGWPTGVSSYASTSGTGNQTISVVASGPADTWTNSYVVDCTLPSIDPSTLYQSGIFAMRVF